MKMADGSPLFVERDSPNMSAKLLQQFFVLTSLKKSISLNMNIKFCNESNAIGKWGVRKGTK